MSSRPSRGAARLAAILDALPDALVLVNANGTVVNANTIALEAFEAPGTALVGRGLLDLLPEFDSRLIPGSMRRPDSIDPRGRTKPTRMTARRTDGSEFPVEVASANLENGQQAYDGQGYTGDELLMLVVRDLSGAVDTEAELARSQRQTEMILRAASEGVVGTDTDGRIVLVNPAASQILGYRASDLGGRELHTLLLHSREDGAPFPYAESPLADTLRSGRKHRVRGQVLWSKAGDKVPVDLTTAPVRDGDQLVGAVMTFTDRRLYDALAEEKESEAAQHAKVLEQLRKQHAEELDELREQHATELEELGERHAEELAAGDERYAALGEREKDRYEALAGRHDQLLAVLGHSLRGPLDQLRGELGMLAADDAGQLWPEANQVLHHLAAGYSRITTLVDNVLGFQRLDAGDDELVRTRVMLDMVVAAGVDGAVELIGPGRVQFAVHAPPIEAEVDQVRLSTALAHLIADVAGVDATGNSPVSAGGYMDSTVVVAAAQRGEVVRIEVRGPYTGGDPVHQPIVRGTVRAHGGVLQTHEVPGMSGSAYVLEVPIGGGAGAVPAQTHQQPVQAVAVGGDGVGGGGGGGAEVALREQPLGGSGPGNGNESGGGRRRAHRSSVDAFLESEEPETEATVAPTGRRRRRTEAGADVGSDVSAGGEGGAAGEPGSGGTGRRRGRPSPAEGAAPVAQGVSEGAVVTAAEHAAGAAATGLGETVPPQGVPVPAGGRRARRATEQHALPPALPASPGGGAPGAVPAVGTPGAIGTPVAADAGGGEAGTGVPGQADAAQPGGRRRRALAQAQADERAAAAQEPAGRAVFALPPAAADRRPDYDATSAAYELPADAPGTPGVPVGMPAGAPGVPASASGVPSGAPGVPAGAPGVPAGAPAPGQVADGRHEAVLHHPADDHTPPQPHPVAQPTGRRRARPTAEEQATAAAMPPQGLPGTAPAGAGAPGTGVPGAGVPGAGAQGAGAPGVSGPVPGLPGVAVPAAGLPGAAVTVAAPGAPQGPGGQGGVPAGETVPGASAAPGVAAAPVQGAPDQVGGPVPASAVPGAPVPGAPAPGASVQAVSAQAVPAQGLPAQAVPAQGLPAQAVPAQGASVQAVPAQAVPPQVVAQAPADLAQPVAAHGVTVPAQQPLPTQSVQAPSQPVPAPGVPTPGQPAPPQGAPGAPQPVPAQGLLSRIAPAQPAQPGVQGQPGRPAAGLPGPGQPVAPAVAPAGLPQPTPGQTHPIATALPAGAQPVVPDGQAPPPAQAQPGTPQAPGPWAPLQHPAPGTPVPGASLPGVPLPQPTPASGTPLPPEQPQPARSTQPTALPTPPPTAQPVPQPTAQPAAPPVAQQTPQAVQSAQAPQPGTAPQQAAPARVAQPLPAESSASSIPSPPFDSNSTQGRAFSVRTLGQGVPFARQIQAGSMPVSQQPPAGSSTNGGRRRKLGTPPEPSARAESGARPHPQPGRGTAPGQTPPGGPKNPVAPTNPGGRAAPAGPGQAPGPGPHQGAPAGPPAPSVGGRAPLPTHSTPTGQVPLPPQPSLAGQSRLVATEGAGRSYAIGAPDKNADEGPEPLDGPGGAVEVSDQPHPQPMDDELPPEPLDNPRRLLVWPAPDPTTQQALSAHGYRPVIVNSREEVNAQISAFPAALFVDPLTGPITRTALQSLRQAAVAAEIPVLVTAGLGQATREAAYGADPAVLFKALAPRDSEQHPPRVLLIEEHAEIALALTATLERRGMQVARAASDTDAVTLAAQMRPNLVVMDLLQVRRRRSGIVDWLRANSQLNRTPLVVYTAAVDQSELPRLASGETVLFLAERSTSAEVQSRLVDLLARMGTN